MTVAGQDLYVGGVFSQIGNLQTTNIARWDGTNWHALGPGLGSLPDERGVLALAFQGQLYAGGVFRTPDDAPLTSVARWDGQQWSSIGAVNGPVFALASDGSNLYAGGIFSVIGGINATNIAKWDGTNWTALGSGVHYWKINDVTGQPFDDGQVSALAVQGGGLSVGGDFQLAGTVGATNVAKWNGTNWVPVGLDLRLVPTQPSDIACVHARSNSSIYCWNGSWSSVGGGFSNGIVCALSRRGSDLYAGGYFSSAGGRPASNVAKWDGTSWTPLGSGPENPGQPGVAVSAISSTGTELFLGGVFTLAGGKPSTNIARWRIPLDLKIKRAAAGAILSWPATGSNLALEASESLGPANWNSLSNAVGIHYGECLVTNGISGPSRFYHLRGR